MTDKGSSTTDVQMAIEIIYKALLGWQDKGQKVWKYFKYGKSIIKKIAREFLIDDLVTNLARYLHAIAIKGENHCCIK